MKQIIILDTRPLQGVGTQVNALFWYPVASGREVPRPGANTGYRNASTAEIAALQSGTVVEESVTKDFITGTAYPTIQAALQAEYTVRRAAFDAKPNPNAYYGESWDGAAWT